MVNEQRDPEEVSQEPLEPEAVDDVQEDEVPEEPVAEDAEQPPGDDEPEESTAPTLDDIPDDRLLELARQRNIRILDEDEEKRLRQSERDRFKAEQEREAGKRENVRKAVSRFLQNHEVEVDDTRQLDYLYEVARGNAAYELAMEFPQALLRHYDLPADVREKAIEAREANNLDGYVQTLIDGAVAQQVQKAEAEVDRRVNDEVNRRLSAEMKARGLESRPKSPRAPSPPRGSEARRGPSPEEYAAATFEQRQQWKKEGVEVVA